MQTVVSLSAMQQQLQPRQVTGQSIRQTRSMKASRNAAASAALKKRCKPEEEEVSSKRHKAAARTVKPGQPDTGHRLPPRGNGGTSKTCSPDQQQARDTRHAVASDVFVSLRSQEVQIAKKHQPPQQAAQHAKPEGVPFKFSSEQAACIAQKSVSVSAQQKTSGADRGVQRTSET